MSTQQKIFCSGDFETDFKVLVVGNPANTNACILSKYAPSIPKENFTCMTRLDQNRAQAQIAARLGVSSEKVRNVIIWGNHSSTQYPDVAHATVEIKGKVVPVREAIKDDNYLNNEFIKAVQQRGAEVIKARKLSSAMSAWLKYLYELTVQSMMLHNMFSSCMLYPCVQ